MTLATLPAEISNEIFYYLDKRDIKKMATVCKSWRQLVSCRLTDSISILLDYYKFTRLLNDLTAFPNFAAKVNQITVVCDDTSGATKLRSIINNCVNLQVLKFKETNIYEFVKMLNSRETVMPRIQNIEIMNLSECSPAIRRFDVWVNYRFRSTITTLQFMDVEENGALTNYGGLMKYLDYFPNLISIKICCDGWDDRTVELNLNELLTVKNKLETLYITGVGRVDGDLQNMAEYTSLKKLHLHRLNIDIKMLTYITKRFTKLEDLSLVASIVTPNDTVPETEAEQIIKDFNELPVEKLSLSYHYKGKCYHNSPEGNPYLITDLFQLGLIFHHSLIANEFLDEHEQEFLDNQFLDEEDYLDHEFFDDEFPDDDELFDDEDEYDELLDQEYMAEQFMRDYYDRHFDEYDDEIDY